MHELSVRLISEYGNGYDERNLRYMRLFYLSFPIWNAVRSELGWTHYRILMRENDPIAREWYMNECLACGWGMRDLERQVSGLLAFGDSEKRCFMTTGSGVPFPDVIDRKMLDFTLEDLEIKSRPPTILNDAEMAEFAAWSAKAAREAGTRDRIYYE